MRGEAHNCSGEFVVIGVMSGARLPTISGSDTSAVAMMQIVSTGIALAAFRLLL